MGRAFQDELGRLPDTVKWCIAGAASVQLERMISTLLPFPLLVVGSGGSLTGAHFIARLHEQITGRMSRAVTPLDLFSTHVNPEGHAVLFLTASGANRDILRAVDIAVQREFAAISIVCAKIGSKVSKKALTSPHLSIFEYDNPAGKDGFLAVNSLLSTCILVARAYGAVPENEDVTHQLVSRIPSFDSPEWDAALDRRTIVTLGGGWAWPALIDFESKLAEAALWNVFISDLRNFGHGRHHWFDKRGGESALLVFETPTFSLLSKKTLALLPSKYPRVFIRSSFEGPLAGIDLLIQVFHLVNEMGSRVGIDPGRPKVPEFGRKIYNLGLPPVISGRRVSNRQTWIKRKMRATAMPASTIEYWLEQFLIKMSSSTFAAIVFDYDGTLCDPPERFTRPRSEIGEAINKLLAQGVIVGVATGRGRSVQKGLREIVAKDYWENVIVGNYNGSIIHPLSYELSPFDTKNISGIIQEANEILKNDFVLGPDRANLETRERQISISPVSPFQMHLILEIVLERLGGLDGIKILQSDHSIDVIEQGVTKLLVHEWVRKELNQTEECHILTIGDRGQYRGNDSEMLSEPFSISVDRVSSSLTTCWNLSPVGSRGAGATAAIMGAVRADKGLFQIDTGFLEREVVR